MKRIKQIYIKAKPKLLIGLSLLLIFIAGLNIYYSVAVRVQSNDECLWVPQKPNSDSTAIYFESVKKNGVAWNAGIRDGDQLIVINDSNLINTAQAQLTLNKVKAGDYAKYVVKKKDGSLLKTRVYVKKLIQFQFLALALLGLIWMTIGFVVLMARRGSIQKIFYLTGATAVLSMVFLLLPQGGGQTNLVRTGFIILLCIGWCFGISFFAFYLSYFFWNFPRQFKFVQKKSFKRIYFAFPTFLAVVFFIFIIFFSRRIPNANEIINRVFFLYEVLIGIGFLVGCISLFINYRKIKEKEERRPLLVILIAYVLAIIAIIYTAQIAPAIADTIFNSPEFYTPIILIIILPISFAYSIFKYQLMDVSIVIKNTIIYGAATITLAAIYFFVIYVIGQSISQAIGTEYQQIIAGVFFIGFALVFQSTKDRFQDFLTAKFYPEQFAYQKVLIRFSNEVASMVGLENILDSMRDTLVDALMIFNFGIMISDQDKKSFLLVRSVGIENKKLALHSSNLQKFIHDKILAAKNPVIEREEFAEVFAGQEELLYSENIYTIIPMIIKSEVVGLLLFGLKHSGALFAGKDVDLLSAAANQSAISIENARLYLLEAQKLKIERDLELAQKIQQGLLPRCIPDIYGLDICGEMISAMQVGGDYFDLIPISDKKLFVIIGDVSGKGLSASLYMAKLQTMMQLYCVDNKSPKEILTQVNKKLYQEMEKSWFVTLTLALFDMEKKKVAYCRAGHVPVIISLNDKIEFYKTTGLGVGLEKGVIFEKTLIEKEIDLSAGQVFAFISDGITEAMNEKNELFGDERLSEILKNKSKVAASDTMNQLWNEIKIFRGSAEQNDDMTAVIVRVK
jgi:sigma-B regulation protein RsbU (phosphoserine phosphatase)